MHTQTMPISEYQKLVGRKLTELTAPMEEKKRVQRSRATLKLGKATGKIQALVGDNEYCMPYSHRQEELVESLGSLLFWAAAVSETHGLSLEACLGKNIERITK